MRYERVLVTGGLGFIGSHVVRRLLIEGCTVLNIDKGSYASNAGLNTEFRTFDGYQFIQEDICNLEEIDNHVKHFRPKLIIHLAAESHVDRSIKNSNNFLSSNIVGTYNLLEIFRTNLSHTILDSDSRFIHVSTDEVFGSLELNTNEKFDEQTAYAPSSPYSATKASSDLLAKAWYTTYNLPIIITNCSNNYGPFQNSEKLIPKIIKNAVAGLFIPIYGDGKNVRDWIHVEDHVDALVSIMEKGRAGETYNIGSDNEHSNLEIAFKICDILDSKLNGEFSFREKIKFVNDRLGHDRRYAVNSHKIQTNLGWVPKINFEDGLEETVSWYLEKQKF